MPSLLFHGGAVLLPHSVIHGGWVRVDGEHISAVSSSDAAPDAAERIDLQGGYLAPGFVDLHVHGGAGADFMDGTENAFRAICRAHARHGTTSLLPTTTVARHEQHLAFLDTCRSLQGRDTGGAHPGRAFLRPLFRAG